MAYILELAGGAASDGYKPILDIVPDGLHVRSPIYLGNKEDVAEVEVDRLHLWIIKDGLKMSKAKVQRQQQSSILYPHMTKLQKTYPKF